MRFVLPILITTAVQAVTAQESNSLPCFQLNVDNFQPDPILPLPVYENTYLQDQGFPAISVLAANGTAASAATFALNNGTLNSLDGKYKYVAVPQLNYTVLRVPSTSHSKEEVLLSCYITTITGPPYLLCQANNQNNLYTSNSTNIDPIVHVGSNPPKGYTVIDPIISYGSDCPQDDEQLRRY